jgi:hypothetical protein
MCEVVRRLSRPASVAIERGLYPVRVLRRSLSGVRPRTSASLVRDYETQEKVQGVPGRDGVRRVQQHPERCPLADCTGEGRVRRGEAAVKVVQNPTLRCRVVPRRDGRTWPYPPQFRSSPGSLSSPPRSPPVARGRNRPQRNVKRATSLLEALLELLARLPGLSSRLVCRCLRRVTPLERYTPQSRAPESRVIPVV